MKKSSSMPLAALGRSATVRDRQNNRNYEEIRFTTQEVQNKVEAMLAATDALKPPSVTSSHELSASKKPRRAGSKVFGKMSSA
jgi:hypothetical protein